MNFHYNSRIKRRAKSESSMYKKIIYAAIVIFIAQFFYYGFWISPSTETDDSNAITLSIQPGEGLKEIAKKLKQENIINSKYLFLSYAKKNDLDKKIQSGVFRIPLPQTIPSTLKIITQVPIEDRITIPEGYKISQIDELLASKNLIAPGEFIQCVQTCNLEHPMLQHIPTMPVRNLEGFLFPDTYFINTLSFTSEYLIIKMLDNFATKLPTDYQEKAESLPEKDLYSIIKMASIIEREVLSQKDKQLVSGILWKRFRSGWLLDADAALLYEKDNNIITKTDLQSNSPYNLRKIGGLPPTPISNPGLSSIQAALDPIESAYWFYLTTLDTGEVIYGKTNDEHNQNRFRYLK